MQLMLHQRQTKKREQQKDAERTKHNHVLRDYQMQVKLLELQIKKRKLMEDDKRAKGRLSN